MAPPRARRPAAPSRTGGGGEDADRAPGLFDGAAADTADAAVPPEAPPGSRENPYTVSALSAQARALLEGRFPSVWIVGEISNFLAHSSGHWYFTLKDEGGELSAVMFSRQNRLLKFEARDGLEVLVRGRPTVYAPRGRFQVVLEEMTPRREGALMLAFRQLEERLRAEGLFDPERRRPIPLLPRRIGIVTSRDGAAFRDILRVLRDRFAGVTVVLRDARVQGEGAAASIAAGIEEMNAYGAVEVLIVGRGGGSLEDLWAFNEPAVVRAIAASAIPVISAVGHEIDVTLSDMAADLRAATPSAAAEQVIASRRELAERLGRLRGALRDQARLAVETRRRRAAALAGSRALFAAEIRVRDERQRLDELVSRGREAFLRGTGGARERLAGLAARLAPRSLLENLHRRRERLAGLAGRLERARDLPLERARAALARLAGLLDSFSPLGVLERGYAICTDATGRRVLRDAAGVAAGETVRVRLRRGRLGCRVLESHPGEAEGT